MLRNVSEHKATLKAFLSVTSEDTENVGISGDPARNVSAKEIGKRNAVTSQKAVRMRAGPYSIVCHVIGVCYSGRLYTNSIK